MDLSVDSDVADPDGMATASPHTVDRHVHAQLSITKLQLFLGPPSRTLHSYHLVR
jgi:hypothetical protein